MIAGRRTGHEYHVDHAVDHFVIRTNDQHEDFRLVTASEDDPSESNWVELLPAGNGHYYHGHVAFKAFLVVAERVDGIDQIRIRHWDGTEHFVDFPEPVYAASIGNNAEYNPTEVRLGFSSMITPQSVYDYDVLTRTLTLRKQQEIPSGYDASPVRH
ncbi:MAG: hypothetical protein U5O39_03620 [Gammaproteobacteria bacterium]|nr:hypothetical protein [Gammaproteobacteria bacterium]